MVVEESKKVLRMCKCFKCASCICSFSNEQARVQRAERAPGHIIFQNVFVCLKLVQNVSADFPLFYRTTSKAPFVSAGLVGLFVHAK